MHRVLPATRGPDPIGAQLVVHNPYNACSPLATLGTCSVHGMSAMCGSCGAHICLSPSSPKIHFYHLASIEIRVLMGTRHTHETPTVTPRIPVRPDWRIRTGFRDARLRTGTLYLIFFFSKQNLYLWVWPTSDNLSKYFIYKSKELPPEWCPSKSRHI